jgi:hypothetical protein
LKRASGLSFRGAVTGLGLLGATEEEAGRDPEIPKAPGKPAALRLNSREVKMGEAIAAIGRALASEKPGNRGRKQRSRFAHGNPGMTKGAQEGDDARNPLSHAEDIGTLREIRMVLGREGTDGAEEGSTFRRELGAAGELSNDRLEASHRRRTR